MEEYKETKVPVKPKRSWTWMKDPKIRCGIDICPHISMDCWECIYSRFNAVLRKEYYESLFELPERDEKGRFCKKEETESYWAGLKVPVAPKREWGSWMTSNEYCPIDKGKECASVEYCKDCVYSEYNRFARRLFYEQWYGKYPISVKKELPSLTQTAFHCPDCPKETAKLKVFPANHVVALDEDDKVLSVMELQCKEGEVKRPEWLFSKAYNRLYRIDDFRQDIPDDAEPVHVQYLTPEELIGLSVKNHNTAKNYLIAAVDGLTVTLLGLEGKRLLSMPTLVQFYSFTANRQPCCIIDFPQ